MSTRRQLSPELQRPLEHLSFGAAQFGNMGRETRDSDCSAAIDAAWSHGIRFFDTAPHYGLGLSEQRLGAALREHPRDEYIISTKVGRLLRPNPEQRGTDEENGFCVPDRLTRVRDYTYDGVHRSLEESLKRLELDGVDILWIHDPEEPTDRFDEALRGAVPALRRLKDEGVIKAWGVGSKDSAMLKRFVDQADPDLLMVAGRYTLLEQDVGLMRACAEAEVGVVAVGVFNSGLLARDEPEEGTWYEYGPAPQEMLERARALAAAARAHGVTLPGAALAFPRRHPAVMNVMAGMRSPAHVERNVALCAAEIPDEFWSELRAEGLLKEEA